MNQRTAESGSITVYTLIKFSRTRGVEVAHARNAYRSIRDLDEVKEVVLTYGEFDIMVKIETNSVEELDYFIFKKIRTIKGVDSITTLIVACAHMGW